MPRSSRDGETRHLLFLKVMKENKVIAIGNINGRQCTSFSGNVYSTKGICPTLNTMGGVIDNH